MAVKQNVKGSGKKYSRVKLEADSQKPTKGLLKQVDKNDKWAILFILGLTFIAFTPVLTAGFVNWDDGDYVNNNPLIKHVSYFQKLITEPKQGNYHPITMLSLAFNYWISGEDAWSFHLLNLILHLVNCYLVFRLAILLSNNNRFIAFTTAILFAIHPMHVESVAWVSERKDVLYGLFFIAGLIAYTKYVDVKSKKQYALAMLFLILSLLSKPAAVIFPVALFSIDLLRKRPFNFKLLLEKLPFFLLSFGMGLLTYLAQKKTGATGEPFQVQNLLVASYGLMLYIVKFFLPFGLTTFYPYPPANESIPAEYYLGPIACLALIALFWLAWKKNRVLAFGISFFVINLILVLQLLPVGASVISERYTYIPYIGLFYALGWFIYRYAKTVSKAYSIVLSVSFVLAILTYIQAGVWKDGRTLWDRAIKSHPGARAYINRAFFMRKDKEFYDAVDYYNKALQFNIYSNEAYRCRGNIYCDLKKYDLAYADYRKALAIEPKDFNAKANLGGLFVLELKNDSAIFYLDQAIKEDPNFKEAYGNRGLAYMNLNKNKEAIRDFEKYVEIDPSAADIYNTIGSCLRSMEKYNESLAQINRAIKLDALPAFYLNRSYTYTQMENKELARQDALTAKGGGEPIPQAYAKYLGIE